MERDTGAAFVRSFALINWLFAAALLIAGFGVLLAPPAFRGLIALRGEGLAAALLALAVLYAAAGAGLWLRARWSRPLALALAVPSLLAYPFGTVLGGGVLWVLGLNGTVKGLFRPARG